MELWDIYNINREKTGRTMVRGQRMKEGDYRIMVHACIFNSQGQMLIQQRQSSKKDWPGMWDVSACGSAVSGDTSGQAAARELEEELGIKLPFENTPPHLTVNFHGIFDDIYLIEKDVDISSLSLQYDEVKDVKWADIDEIFKLIDDGAFIPYHKSLITLFFDMRSTYGTVNRKK